MGGGGRGDRNPNPGGGQGGGGGLLLTRGNIAGGGVERASHRGWRDPGGTGGREETLGATAMGVRPPLGSTLQEASRRWPSDLPVSAPFLPLYH